MATVEKIKRDMAKKVVKAMESTKIKVRDIMYDVCMTYYNEYDPTMYRRTFQIAHAIYDFADAAVKGRMVGASFEVYVDSSMLSHDNGSWSEEKILYGVMTGGVASHGGAMQNGTPVWVKGAGIINNEIKDIVKQELIKAGLPIV